MSVSQLATQGKSVGSALGVLPISIAAGSNDTLSLIVNGISASVTLAARDYASADALAAELQSKINGVSALSTAGATVAVTASSVDGALTVTSQKYGSTSNVNITSGTALATLGLAATTESAGVD